MSMLHNSGAGAPPPAGDLVKDTTTQTFMADVIEESKHQPVLVDFWAPWCGPCKQLAPVIEKVVRAAKGKVKLTKMNIDDHPAIPGQLGIQSIPAVIAFVDGQPTDGFMGAQSESQVTAFIDRLAGGKGEDQTAAFLKAAEQELAGGNPAGAAGIYAQILSQDAENVVALAGLARCHLVSGEIDLAKQTLVLVPPAKAQDPAVAAVRSAIELAEQAQAVGPIAELEGKVAANPADHQARFDLAVALNAKGEREAASTHLLDIVKRDRTWNEDGARKQLVQFFEAWGPTDEATVNARRRLSSLLFS